MQQKRTQPLRNSRSQPAPGATWAEAALEGHVQTIHQSLAELVRLIQFRDRDRICCHGISVSQCYALVALVREGPLRLNDLAGRLFLDKSTASRVADGLVRKGYVERRADPEDSRAVLLEATPDGRQLERRIEADLLAETRAVLEGMGPEVRRGVSEVMQRLVRRAGARVEAQGGCCKLLPRE